MSFVSTQVGAAEPQLMTIDSRGGTAETLFAAIPDLEAYLTWSPDGTRAVVARHGDRNLYLADTEAGTIATCVSCGVERPTTAAFSPEGSNIAFGAREGLYVISVDGTGLQHIADQQSPSWISWSPDGRQIAFASAYAGQDVFVVDPDGERLRNVSEGGRTEQGQMLAPQWSPLGDRIAAHLLDQGLHLVLLNPDGSGMIRLAEWATSAQVFDPLDVWPPQWSPDGSRLAFASVSHLGDSEIFVVNADGTGLTNLTNSPGDDAQPVWSPDGRLIAFASNRDGNWEIYVMDTEGSGQLNLSNSPSADDLRPAWRP